MGGTTHLDKGGESHFKVCSYDFDNNRYDGRMLRNSLSKEFARHCDESIIKSEHGIKIFCEILRVSFSINPSVTETKLMNFLNTQSSLSPLKM